VAASPLVVVAKAGDQGGYGQHQEADRPADPWVAHPQMRTQGANETKDEPAAPTP
jgi:hypothetical protein